MRGDVESFPCLAANVDGKVAKLVAVEAMWFVVTCAMDMVGVLAWAKQIVVLGMVAFATLVALDSIPWHWATVGNMAQFVASAALQKWQA